MLRFKVSYLLLLYTVCCVLLCSVWGAEVSITLDDFDIHENTMLSANDRNDRILLALKKRRKKAALFVVCKNIQTKRDFELLNRWGEGGHLIGNHTFNHRPFDSKVSLDSEIHEILRCQETLENVKGFKKLFRFPMLAEGDTAAKRDRMRTWLGDHGYKVGSVTIDASDWYIDERLKAKFKENPLFDLTKFRDYYLEHIWDRANYYQNLSRKVLGRDIKHTLLIHFNLLNALYLDDLISMFEHRGWKIIDAEEAFGDKIYSRLPKSMPSGQSLIWAFAKATGLFDRELRYPGEDDIYEKPKMDALGL